jgi:16S rRNA (guanine966-N2)-methyltransferase
VIITGGALRGRRLTAPAGLRTRPTPARVKEALFSMLRDHLSEARVLDLYAGTGSLAFEALSRGAAEAVCVEAHPPTAALIRKCAEALGLSERCEVIAARAESCAGRLRGPFDLIFADPPYAIDPPTAIFESLLKGGLLSDGAVIAYEHSADRLLLAPPPQFELWRSKTWGRVGLHLFTRG